MSLENRAQEPRLFGVLVTYRRPEWLRTSLEAIGRQTRTLDALVVVDNAPDESNRRLVESVDYCETTYLASPGNLGPAGGLADGVDEILRRAADDDWIVFLDDDDPPRTDDAIERLAAFGNDLVRQGEPLGGVGLSGSRLDRRSGRLVRIADDELTGQVSIDYIGGNQLPHYVAGALRRVGAPDRRLFFGFDDLDIGLRLTEAGLPLYSQGEARRAARQQSGRTNLDVQPSRRLSAPPGWRRYYSLRNQIWLLRQRGMRRQALMVALTQGLAKPLGNLATQPRWALAHLRLNARAVLDGFRGRLGLTVDPSSEAGSPTS